MQYSSREIHTLNILSDDPMYSRYFNTPLDLKFMVVGIFICFTFAILGAIFFKVDKIVPAQGVLDTQAELFEVRNTEPGFISHVLVQEGDMVHAGDLLVQFDAEQVDLKIDQAKQQLENLARNIWTRFYQINDLVDAHTRQELVAGLAEVDNPIARLGYQSYLSKPFLDTRAVNQQSRASLSQKVASARNQYANLQAREALQQAELERIQGLYQAQIESKATLDQAQANLLSLQSQLESVNETITSLQSEGERLQKEQAQTESSYILERLVGLHDQLDNYHTTFFQLESLERSKHDLGITSPINGTVDAMLIQGDKERIPEATTLLSIRPSYTENELEIDIEIPANYAIWVEPGMTFRASSLGNNPDDHGYVMGEISFIASSSQKSDQSSGRVYRMTGKITEITALRADARDALLRPGSALSVEIRAGERRLINYIFDPFTKYLRTALSEPS